MHHGMSNPLSLSARIEALLLFRGGAIRVSEIAKSLEETAETILDALAALKDELSDRGVSLVEEGDRVALTTSRDAAEVIEKLRRDELEGSVGKAGLETLAVIVYQGPVTRAEIEYVRGVNVSTMLRSLMIRGLIERVDNPKDKRSFLYRATTELPAFLGVATLSDLPGYERVREEIIQVLSAQPKVEEVV
jgi:segregation and condensation protein B